MLGHTKISTTQIYAKVDEEKITDDMTGIDDKMEKKREIIMAAKQLINEKMKMASVQ